MTKKIKVEAYFTKTLKEKALLEIEISEKDLKKIESKEIDLEECIHDYVYDYKYEVIGVMDSDVIDNEIKEITSYKI